MIKYLIKGQNIETLEHEIIAADQIAFVKIHFVFDNSWKPLHKVVQFSQDKFTYNRVLGFDDTSCLLPAELTPGAVKMSLFGYDASASETIRATTVVKTLNIRPSGFDGESESPIPPTPDLYQQLLQKISEKGGNGKSAYEIALEHGFVGTEAEWLESLKGKDGAVGPQGEQGPPGADGQPGKNGEQGSPGVDGRDGLDGTNGKSAFEIAVENGFVGSETEWLESLKGKDGADGRDGADGAVGPQGEQGPPGKDGVTPDMSEYSTKADYEDLQRKLQSLQDSAMDYILGLTNRCDSLNSSIQEKEKEILNLETRIIALENHSGIEYITVFSSGNDTLQKYGESIYTYYNDGYRSLAGFSESYPHFCCAENDFALYFNQTDFSWAGTVFVLCLTLVVLTASMHLILGYTVGASQDAEFYLVRKTDKTGSELARYIYEQIQSGDALELSFKWLYSDTYVSVMQSLETVPDGEYYLAFKGTSDNSHPMVESIKFMKG